MKFNLSAENYTCIYAVVLLEIIVNLAQIPATNISAACINIYFDGKQSSNCPLCDVELQYICLKIFLEIF